MGSYTLVGVFEGAAEDRGRVFIPAGIVPQVMDLAQSGPVLGQAGVPNDRAEEFYLEMVDKLPFGVQMTLYDQGYAAAAAPFADILRAAQLILLACAAVGLAILALFAYLFIYRQRAVMGNMHRLGVPKGASAVYFLSGSGLLALISALTGTVLAWLLSGQVTDLVTKLLQAYDVTDTRFSITTIGVRKAFAFQPAMALWVFAVTALLVWLCAMTACLLFAGRMMARRHGRRKAARRRHGQSRSLRGGAWKFAWLSALRGGGKSLTPLCVLLCAVVLLGLLPFTAQDYQRQQREIEAHTSVLGYFTNSNGRLADGATIPSNQLQTLEDLTEAEEMTVTWSEHYGTKAAMMQTAITSAGKFRISGKWVSSLRRPG